MKRTRLFYLLGVIMVILVLLAACNGGAVEPPAGSAPTAAPQGEEQDTPEAEDPGENETGMSLDALIEALEAAGLSVEEAGAIEDPLFGVDGQTLTVNGAMVQVFEFDSEADAEAAASTVNASGTIVGTTTIDWIETPHFYRQGRLIVLYAGSDEAILAALQEVIGEPFVVGQTMGLPSGDGENSEPSSQGDLVVDYASLVDALQAAGAEVEPQEAISQPFFSPEAQIIQVNGEDVQVFEFADESAAEEAAATVSPDGTEVGTSMVTWVATPHFYRSGQVIVIYVGDNAGTLNLLQEVLGEPFAGG